MLLLLLSSYSISISFSITQTHCLHGEGVRRTLPAVATAYPRVSKIAEDPHGGLASVEALYFAKLLLGERDDSLLNAYYWRETFIETLKSDQRLR